MLIPHTVCEHMHKLKPRARGINLPRDRYLYLEQDASDSVYMLEQGMVILTKLMPDGNEVGIILISGNNLFGQCEVISGASREHQARSLTPCKLWKLDAETFLDQTRHSSEFAMALAKLQNERLRHMERHIGAISKSSVSKRLTSTLIDIARDAGCNHQGVTSIKPCPTHQDLATMIASSRETVSSIMNQLRKQNLIAFSRQELSILDTHGLAEFANE